MSLQDGLLSFQIKETIFLSSDKADIRQIKELELIPDVEIIENTHELSITGCLQLHGRYEGGKNTGASPSDDTDSLLEAMKFTPFHLQGEETKQYLFQDDVELNHRIPLNVSIPLARIEELGEIYAIVDSLDFEVKTPHQLQIQADLKISGIYLKNVEQPRVQEESVSVPQLEEQEKWEFVHVADTQNEQENTPSSIEEIERKLEQLEREVAAREEQYNNHLYTTSEQYPSTPFVTTQAPTFPYFPPYQPQAPSQQHEELPESEENVEITQAVANAEQTTEIETEAYETEYSTDKPESYQTGGHYESQYQSHYQSNYESQYGAQYESQPEAQYESHYEAQGEAQYESHYEAQGEAQYESHYEAQGEAQYESHYEAQGEAQYESHYEAQGEAQYESQYETEAQYVTQDEAQEQLEYVEANNNEIAQGYDDRLTELHEDHQLIEVAEVVQEEEAVNVEETAEATQDIQVASTIPEPKEMKVAISSKPAKEKDDTPSITSLFTSAGRSKAEQASVSKNAESSNTANYGTNDSAKASVSLLRNNLGSIARDSEQKFSRLKMCIIQRDETIQTIAERYSLPVSRIVEVNHLASDRIVEGQVLYIPQ